MFIRIELHMQLLMKFEVKDRGSCWIIVNVVYLGLPFRSWALLSSNNSIIRHTLRDYSNH